MNRYCAKQCVASLYLTVSRRKSNTVPVLHSLLFIYGTLTATSKHKIQIPCTFMLGNLTTLRETTKESSKNSYCRLQFCFSFFLFVLLFTFKPLWYLASAADFDVGSFSLRGGEPAAISFSWRLCWVGACYVGGLLCILYWFYSQLQECFTFAYLPCFQMHGLGSIFRWGHRRSQQLNWRRQLKVI